MLDRQKGFTLVELVIAFFIVAILAFAMFVPVWTQHDKTLIAKARADLDALRVAILKLKFDTGRWAGDWPNCMDIGVNCVPEQALADWNNPKTGLVATDGTFKNWQGPYLDKINLDPWGRHYFFFGNPSGINNNGVYEPAPCNGECPGCSSICSGGPDLYLSEVYYQNADGGYAAQLAQHQLENPDDICVWLN